MYYLFDLCQKYVIIFSKGAVKSGGTTVKNFPTLLQGIRVYVVNPTEKRSNYADDAF